MVEYIDHEFKALNGRTLPKSNCALINTDICVFCNKSIKEIFKNVNRSGIHGPQLNYKSLKENYDYIIKCLTKEEYIIKKLIE